MTVSRPDPTRSAGTHPRPPELEETAELLRASGLPDDLMHAAAVILERWEEFKDRADVSLDLVAALRRRVTG